MKSLTSATRLLPLALLLAAMPSVYSRQVRAAEGGQTASTPPAAPATPNRDAKEQRRVLKAKDVSSDNVSEEYRQMARQKRHESMKFLKELLSQGTAQGEQKAEMMLRLADLYFEEGRDIYLTEMSKYEAAYDKCYNDKQCDPTQLKSTDYTTESKDWQAKSIKLYQQILTNYPQYQRADEATYYLASAFLDTQQPDEAVKEFTRLVRTYPQSGWVPDSYVMIGEYYFDNNNAYKALVAYQKAAAYKDSDKYAFALYKLAWCFYNVGEYGKAIDTMKTVVAHSMSSSESNQTAQQKKIQLEEEALKDLVRFFADAGEMDEAYAYFNKLGKKDLIRSMLKRLAQTYFEQGKFDQCIQTYRRLIAEDPQSIDAPEYQNEIIAAYQKINKKDDTLTEIDRLLKNYGKNSAWSRANASSPDAVSKAREFIEKNLRTVATNYHAEAKKLGSGQTAKDTYALAYKAYTVYLNEFPDSQYAYDVRYAFGELLYKIKKFDEAYDQYMKVVSLDPKGSHSEFCSESAIYAADEMVKKTGGGQTAQGNSTEPIDMTEWEKKSLAALDQYAKLFPESKKTKNIIYKSAYLLYNKNLFKEASDRFRVVINMDPASKEAEQAANLILDSFNLVQDWANLKDVAKAFYDQQGLGSQSFKKETYEVYERASFKLIEVQFKKSNDKVVAADSYWAFYQEFPQSVVADVALNNSAVYYSDMGHLQDAMKVRHELVEKFPKSKYYNDQVAALGFDYESIADFQNASNWYEKLFSINKDHASAADAIYSAGLFRRALGDWQGAIKDLQQYITAYPTRENIDQVTLLIAQIYEDNQKWTEASKVYQTFFKRTDLSKTPIEQVYFARLRYGLDLKQLGQEATVEKHWKDTLAEFEKARAKGVDVATGVESVAQMMFDISEDQYKAYEAMQISGPANKNLPRKQMDKTITDQVVAKGKALQKIEATYANIINTGAGEWGIAALVRLGEAYENMASSLKNSYVPAYLTPDQRELYLMALEDKVYPQIEKAVEAYKKALDKSFELSLYNENVAHATRRLGELKPDDYPGLEESLLTPAYATTHLYNGEFELNP
jgi:cellulose synthase operon protein C